MHKRHFLAGLSCAAVLALSAGPALAQDNVFKIGLIAPLTGPFASTGKQIEAAARLYMAQHGDSVAGRKVQVIGKDETGLPDRTNPPSRLTCVPNNLPGPSALKPPVNRLLCW